MHHASQPGDEAALSLSDTEGGGETCIWETEKWGGVTSQGRLLKDKVSTRQIRTPPLQTQGASLWDAHYVDEATSHLWPTFSPTSKSVLVLLCTAPWLRKWGTRPSSPVSGIISCWYCPGQVSRENSALYPLSLLVPAPLSYCLRCWDKQSSLAVQTGLSYQQATAKAVQLSFLVSSGAG